MENKINVAKLLKDCPKGIKLYSPLCGDCELYNINDQTIRIKVSNKDVIIDLYHDGKYCPNGEIMIFPKGKTTWDGFQRPFKDGDILAHGDTIFIYNGVENNLNYNTYVIIDIYGAFAINIPSKKYNTRFATEEEKQKLFDAIKANGYKWNAKTKTLEKLDSSNINVNALKPFDKVLVRDHSDCIWRADFYSHYEQNQQYRYVCTCCIYRQCIPYNEETANLVGTTNDCPDKYKTWKDE